MTSIFSSRRRCFLFGQRHNRGIARAAQKARGLKVAAQKLDPYINVEPGTMSPYHMVRYSLPRTVQRNGS
jgi:hypothetical protein